MTPEDVPGRKEFSELAERIDDLENEMIAIKELPGAVAKLHGAVDTLTGMVSNGFNQIGRPIEKPTDVRSTIQFISLVIVPVIVALIGGYFVLKASGVNGGK